MATIRRHPVPADSYDPNRPLNDLLLAQLDHFKHIAKGLPAEFQNAIPSDPSVEDREGVDRFIAAVTSVHVSRKKVKPLLVAKPGAKPVSRKQSVTLDLAAVTEEQPNRTRSSNAKSKAKRGGTRGSKP
jgi:hypothetical protein